MCLADRDNKKFLCQLPHRLAIVALMKQQSLACTALILKIKDPDSVVVTFACTEFVVHDLPSKKLAEFHCWMAVVLGGEKTYLFSCNVVRMRDLW